MTRQEAIGGIMKLKNYLCAGNPMWDITVISEVLDTAIEALEQEQRWIPFRSRPLTAEEKEEHPEWEAIFESPLPDDGQRILVNIKYKGHEAVQMDEYYDDDGCYLDSGYEIGTEATAWMPLPEPWEGQNETNRR